MVKQLASDRNRVIAEWWFKPDITLAHSEGNEGQRKGMLFKLKGFKCLFEILMGIVFMMNCLSF